MTISNGVDFVSQFVMELTHFVTELTVTELTFLQVLFSYVYHSYYVKKCSMSNCMVDRRS